MNTRFKKLTEFTKGTMFELSEVVQASNELQSLRKYSQETLTMLSNLAMGRDLPIKSTMVT